MEIQTEPVVYLKTRWKLFAVEHHSLSPESEGASCPIRRTAGGTPVLRCRCPVTITVAWHDLATTVAKKWNGNQMQIWFPFVFYPPGIYQPPIFLLPETVFKNSRFSTKSCEWGYSLCRNLHNRSHVLTNAGTHFINTAF